MGKTLRRLMMLKRLRLAGLGKIHPARVAWGWRLALAVLSFCMLGDLPLAGEARRISPATVDRDAVSVGESFTPLSLWNLRAANRRRKPSLPTIPGLSGSATRFAFRWS